MLEVGLHRKVWQQFNRLIDYIDEISPRQGFGIKTSRTPNGTMISAAPTAAAEAPSAVQWRGEWSASETYVENDMVIRGGANPAYSNDTTAILSDGLKAGLYIAIQDIPTGTEPKEPPDPDYWETMARFASPIFVARAQGSASTSKITLNAGAANGTVTINLADCNGKTLTIREVPICVDGMVMHMMILGSAPY